MSQSHTSSDGTTYSDLNDAEKQWIEELSQPLMDGGVAGTPKELSDYFSFTQAEWHDSPENDREDPSAVITAVGVTVGVMLAKETGLSWKVGADEDGTDLALCDASYDFVVWPINAVAKRWMTPKKDDLKNYMDTVIQARA